MNITNNLPPVSKTLQNGETKLQKAELTNRSIQGIRDKDDQHFVLLALAIAAFVFFLPISLPVVLIGLAVGSVIYLGSDSSVSSNHQRSFWKPTFWSSTSGVAPVSRSYSRVPTAPIRPTVTPFAGTTSLNPPKTQVGMGHVNVEPSRPATNPNSRTPTAPPLFRPPFGGNVAVGGGHNQR